MITKIILPESAIIKYLVERGSNINRGDTLANVITQGNDHVIDLSVLLSVKPSRTKNFLKKKKGDYVFYDEIIAERKSLLYTYIIRSPINGYVRNIDLFSGKLHIAEKREELSANIYSPIDGVVKEIADFFILLEFKGSEIEAASVGSETEVCSEIIFLKQDVINASDIDDSVEGKIVVGRIFSEDAAIKMEVLKAKGIVTGQAIKLLFSIPVMVVNSDIEEIFGKNLNRRIWLKPKEGKLIIIDK